MRKSWSGKDLYPKNGGARYYRTRPLLFSAAFLSYSSTWSSNHLSQKHKKHKKEQKGSILTISAILRISVHLTISVILTISSAAEPFIAFRAVDHSTIFYKNSRVLALTRLKTGRTLNNPNSKNSALDGTLGDPGETLGTRRSTSTLKLKNQFL